MQIARIERLFEMSDRGAAGFFRLDEAASSRFLSEHGAQAVTLSETDGGCGCPSCVLARSSTDESPAASGTIVTDFTALLNPTLEDYSRWNYNDDMPVIGVTFVTYSFRETADLPDPSSVAYDPDEVFSYTEAQRQQVRDAFDYYTAVTGIVFVETEDRGMLDFMGVTGSGYGGYAYYPSIYRDISNGVYMEGTDETVFNLGVLLHEIGHAVGLKHPFEGAIVLDTPVDNKDYTVMSYTGGSGPVTDLGPLDVDALHYLYGTPVDLQAAGISHSWNEATNELTINGGSGDDNLSGVNFTNIISGSAGHDQILGGAGNDTLNGDGGSDTILGGLGDDIINGGSGHDDLSGGYGTNTVNGGTGNDTIRTLSGSDTVSGDDGNDTFLLTYLSSGTSIDGGADTDTVSFEEATSGIYANFTTASLTSIEEFLGSDFDDTFFGSVPGAEIRAGLGDDTFRPTGGGHDLFGGGGTDTVYYWGSSVGVTVNLTTGMGTGGYADGDTYSSIENIVGTSYNDVLTGNSADNVFTYVGGSDSFDGAGGIDLISFEFYANSHEVDLRTNSFKWQSGNSIYYSYSGFSATSIEGAIGSSVGDLLTGDDNANRFEGRGGNDTIDGNGGNDELDGGSGDDDIQGGSGDDTLIGGDGNDYLNGELGSDRFSGGAGDDIIVVDDDDIFSDGNTALDLGGDGRDRLVIATGSTFITNALSAFGFEIFEGADGNDQVRGNDGSVNYELLGGDGDDELTGNDGDDELNGGRDDDILIGGLGADLLIGSTGNDTIHLDDDDIRSDAGGIINLGGAGLDTLIIEAGSRFVTNVLSAYGFEIFEGAERNDRVRGNRNDTDYILDGGEGDDELTGNGGNDTLIGGLGADLLMGGGGDDTIYFDSDDIRNDGGAVDIGGAGRDTLIIETGSQFVTNGLGVYGIEVFRGADGNDRVRGNLNSVDYDLDGGDGNDTLESRNGSDILTGGPGDDIMIGAGGGDTMSGGIGVDTVSYVNAAGRVEVRLYNQTATGSQANGDTISGIENAIGGRGNDALIGSDLANRLEGGDGDDLVSGQGGDDTLIGGLGDDRYRGGDGNDTFIIEAGAEEILDFETGDTVDLTAFTSITSFSALSATHTQDSADSVFDLGSGNTLRITNTTLGELSGGDFDFAAPPAPPAAAPASADLTTGQESPLERALIEDQFEFDGVASGAPGEARFAIESDWIFANEQVGKLGGYEAAEFSDSFPDHTPTKTIDLFDFVQHPDEDFGFIA